MFILVDVISIAQHNAGCGQDILLLNGLLIDELSVQLSERLLMSRMSSPRRLGEDLAWVLE